MTDFTLSFIFYGLNELYFFGVAEIGFARVRAKPNIWQFSYIEIVIYYKSVFNVAARYIGILLQKRCYSWGFGGAQHRFPFGLELTLCC